MLAPRPTKNGCVLVLLPCLTDSSLASTATVVVTVYLPLTAVHVPMFTGGDVAPAAMVPENEPVSVRIVAPDVASLRTRVMPCAPDAEATLPWFLMDTEKVTVLPAAGLPGDHDTAAGSRSEVWTGATTRLVEPVKVLLASLVSK